MNLKLLLPLTLLLIVIVIQSDAANILVVFPMSAFSHYNLGNKLMHALADHGHNVTMIGAFRDKNLPDSCKEIYLKEISDMMTQRNPRMMNFLLRFTTLMIVFMSFFSKEFTKLTFANPEVQELLKDPNQKFDVIVIEEFVNHAVKAFSYHFDAPLVMFSTMGATSWVNKLVANPAPWSYVPDIFLSSIGPMSVWKRVYNAFLQTLQVVLENLILIPQMNSLVREYFPGAPDIQELNKNVSLILLNSHVSTNRPVPLLPNMIEVGGYHVDPPKELPEELQKYLDGCKNGFIYFSMGSNFQSKNLPNETLNAVLTSFSKLNMDVLWKFEDDALPGKPKNVRIEKWLPQQDILAHPNIKLFITHGGLLSTIETIYHGVPIVGIPVMGDQYMNMANAVSAGYAVQLDLQDLSEEALSAALHEVLNNPKYAESARRRSKLMHDRERSPKDTAVYWIEYAIRHKGEKHYRSAALDLAWYELYMVDAAIFVAIVASLQMYLSYRVVRYLWLRRQNKSKKEKQS